MMSSDLAGHEFPRLVSVARIGADEVSHAIAATAAECAALAQRFGLVALDNFTAEIRLVRDAVGIRLAAEFAAEIVQLCGVTLEPFASRVADRFTLYYRREEPPGDPAVEDADYEILAGEEIDIGEAVAQQLSLVLDPFPRAPGAEIAPEARSAAESAPPAHPFAALARLRKK